MLTKEYDFGVYGAEPDLIKLTAYTLYRDFGGSLSTNYDNEFITLELTRQEDEAAIEWLVATGNRQYPPFYEEYMKEDYSEYDNWLSEYELITAETPAKITGWVSSLPEYEMIDQTQLTKENN
jgi:hypothetical protein